jgi:hypothetical protein
MILVCRVWMKSIIQIVTKSATDGELVPHCARTCRNAIREGPIESYMCARGVKLPKDYSVPWLSSIIMWQAISRGIICRVGRFEHAAIHAAIYSSGLINLEGG